MPSQPHIETLSAVELDLFSAVGQGATAAEVASRLQSDGRATEMLMNALVALEILQKKGEVFSNTQLADHYLAEGSLDNVRLAMMHAVHLWDRWSTLTESVRAGGTKYVSAEGRDQRWTEAFIAAMDRNVKERARGAALSHPRRRGSSDGVPDEVVLEISCPTVRPQNNLLDNSNHSEV